MHDDEPTMILKRDALGRVTLRREKREALLDEYERSGLKGTQFARVAGINYGTFASWVQDRRHARGDYAAAGNKAAAALPAPKALRLMEAVMTPPAKVLPPTVQPVQQALEVVLPGGAKMLVADAPQVALAAQLINALRVSSSC